MTGTNRQTILVAALAVVLLLVVFYVFAFRPQQAELTSVQQDTAGVQEQQAAVRAEIVRLHEVRANAPAIEADIAAAEAVIPGTAGLPGAVRQLQLAADESGGRLESITMSRPSRLDDADSPDLAELQVGLVFKGGYFQQVDFLRRLEDPLITPRALVWSSMSVDEDAYPTLALTLTGRMFAVLPGGEEGAEAPAPAPANDEAAEETTDGASTSETSPVPSTSPEDAGSAPADAPAAAEVN